LDLYYQSVQSLLSYFQYFLSGQSIQLNQAILRFQLVQLLYWQPLLGQLDQ
jgi:hypothetical protein